MFCSLKFGLLKEKLTLEDRVCMKLAFLAEINDHFKLGYTRRCQYSVFTYRSDFSGMFCLFGCGLWGRFLCRPLARSWICGRYHQAAGLQQRDLSFELGHVDSITAWTHWAVLLVVRRARSKLVRNRPRHRDARYTCANSSSLGD